MTVIVEETPPLTPIIVSQSDVTCNAANNGSIQLGVTGGTPPYNFNWSGSTSNQPIASDLYAGNQKVTITDMASCLDSVVTILGEPDPLAIDYFSQDTMICPESSITLDVVASGGSSAYVYSWFENGNAIGNGSSILVDPLNDNTYYSVIVSELCGSPVVADTLEIVFPTPIDISFIPEFEVQCVPANFL